jgi:hypothetical protein
MARDKDSVANPAVQHKVNYYFTHLVSFYACVEVSTTRGRTALVYCLINSSLYTGTVQG